MGAVHSDGTAFNFTDKVLPSLTSAVGLPIEHVQLLHDHLKSLSPTHKNVSPNFMLGILLPLNHNPLPIIEAFKTKPGTINERIINIYYFLTSLCIYSSSTWIHKTQCKIYTVLYNIFSNQTGCSFGFKEMKSLVSNVVNAVCIMSGRKSNLDKTYKTITDKIFNGAGLNKKYKLSYTE